MVVMEVFSFSTQTAFYLPTDTNRLVHIANTTTTKEVSSEDSGVVCGAWVQGSLNGLGTGFIEWPG